MKNEKKYSERHEYHQYHQYQQQQGLYTNVSSNNNSIAYRNFVQSIKSPRSRENYAKSSQYYMNWLSLYDNGTILRKDPKLIASDIIDYIIYLRTKRS